MLKLITALICFLLFENANAQLRTDNLLVNILRTNKDSLFSEVLANKDKYRLQIIYTKIDRNKNNKPSFTNYYFNNGYQLYFNPASTVKFPLALLSLEKLNELHKPGVTKYTSMLFDSSESWQKKLYTDSTAENNLPSIAQFIRKAFLISDNDAYNRMYQFAGQQTINENLHEKGFVHTQITRQFMGLTPEQNRYTNQIRFIDNDGKTIYTQPAAYNKDSFDFSRKILLGKGYLNYNDSLVNEPMDFTKHNLLPLEDLQQMLQGLMFPQSVSQQQRFNLTDSDYAFLYKFLSQYPSKTSYPKYDADSFYDSYVKFFFQKGGHQMPLHIRVFNKVGWAYGFLTDVSYIADFAHNTEFMLSATIYVNNDDILNDDKYEYENIGLPFLYQLGQTIYNYDVNRPRKYKANLDAFKINYDKRNANDKRPTIKVADN